MPARARQDIERNCNDRAALSTQAHHFLQHRRDMFQIGGMAMGPVRSFKQEYRCYSMAFSRKSNQAADCGGKGELSK